jgi:hypothetical protein
MAAHLKKKAPAKSARPDLTPDEYSEIGPDPNYTGEVFASYGGAQPAHLKKLNPGMKTFSILAKTTVESTIEIKAASFADAVKEAEGLSVYDFVTFKGEEFSHNDVEIESISAR